MSIASRASPETVSVTGASGRGPPSVETASASRRVNGSKIVSAPSEPVAIIASSPPSSSTARPGMAVSVGSVHTATTTHSSATASKAATGHPLVSSSRSPHVALLSRNRFRFPGPSGATRQAASFMGCCIRQVTRLGGLLEQAERLHSTWPRRFPQGQRRFADFPAMRVEAERGTSPANIPRARVGVGRTAGRSRAILPRCEDRVAEGWNPPVMRRLRNVNCSLHDKLCRLPVTILGPFAATRELYRSRRFPPRRSGDQDPELPGPNRSPARSSPTGCLAWAWRSRWTAGAGSSTTSSSNGCGGRLRTRVGRRRRGSPPRPPRRPGRHPDRRPGVEFAPGSMIGAAAVVTRDTEPDTVHIGIPARPAARRPSERAHPPTPDPRRPGERRDSGLAGSH